MLAQVKEVCYWKDVEKEAEGNDFGNSEVQGSSDNLYRIPVLIGCLGMLMDDRKERYSELLSSDLLY